MRLRLASIMLVAVALWVAALGLAFAYRFAHFMPACVEDVVLVGTGDFHDGRWDSYACGPAADSYKEGP